MYSFTHVKLTILYGSQTGNAQDLAERICRESKIYYFKSHVKALDEYDIEKLLLDECIVFICSTTGQGDVPDNMRKFWRFILKKNLNINLLSHLKFAVFGLGDSSYVKFNFTAKKLFKRLQQLGGNPIFPIGLGDDQHDLGYDATADPWIEQLWKELLILYPLPSNVVPLESSKIKISPKWTVCPKLLGNVKNISHNQSIYYSTKRTNEFDVEVISNERLTDPDHFQDVRLIKLKTNGEKYNPGDVVVLRPKNLPWQVEEFRDVLCSNGISINWDATFSFKEKDPDTPLPEVLQYDVTFGQLCEQYFDLMTIPRRRTFEILANITDSEIEKEKCEEFTTAEGQEELYSYCNRPKRNTVEVLKDFPHATKNLTVELLFEIFPPIKPREFSIASSCSWHKKEIHIILAVVKYKTRLQKERFGLCSNYLAGLKSGEIVNAWIKKGSFKFPTDKRHTIMIGPGTGLAPFRNYIYECVHNNAASADNLILFFGCRNESKDFHCKDELSKLHDDKKLKLVCAFSRDQDRKVYVQDKIWELNHTIWEFMKLNCFIFIAGSARSMPQDVRKTFLKICREVGEMSDIEAEQYLSRMERENRYQIECWS